MNKKWSTALGCAYLFSANLAHAQLCSQPPLSQQHFTKHSNGTTTDTRTGLTWKTCLEGQIPPQCEGEPLLMSWEEAMQYAQEYASKRLAGQKGWRLPTIQELQTLVEPNCQEPATNLQMFPGTPAAGVWTIEQSPPQNAWSVDFSKGKAYAHLQWGGRYVRLVRTND